MERMDDLLPLLREHGGLAALLVDLTPLGHVEHVYGSRAYTDVLESATNLILELSGTEVRGTDLFASSDRSGDGFLVFLSPPEHGGAARLSELEALARRVENYLNASLARLESPYLQGRTRIVVGYGLSLQNPLISPERLVSRLVQDAWECVNLARSEREFRAKCLLQELLIHEEVGTVYQPCPFGKDA